MTTSTKPGITLAKHHFAFCLILRFMSFGASCHLAFHFICVSCHFAFHVILHFAILAIIVIIVTKVLNGINAKVFVEDRCVLKKWPPRIVIGRYGYKSSFGAKNDRPGDDGTLRSV